MPIAKANFTWYLTLCIVVNALVHKTCIASTMILPTSPSPTDLTAFFGLFLMMAVWNNAWLIEQVCENYHQEQLSCEYGVTWWTNTSSLVSFLLMNPYPDLTLNHFTVPLTYGTWISSNWTLPTCQLAKIRGILDQRSECTCDELGLDNLLRFTLVAITSFAGSSSSFTWSTGILGGIFTTHQSLGW